MIREILSAIGNLLTWFVMVAPWEQALRVRMGKHVRRLEPGFYIRIPFVDRIYRQSVRRRLNVCRPQTLTTIDGKTVTLGGTIGYHVESLEKLYATLHDAADTIESEVAGVVADFVATNNISGARPSLIEEHVRSTLDLSRYGLGGQEFHITSFAVVRTHRLITGEFAAWSRGGDLNTVAIDGKER